MTQLMPDVRLSHTTDQPLEILRFADSELKAGRRCALVTLIEIEGGASRALGAHMAVSENGCYCGYISGGCVEATVARDAVIAIAKGQSSLLRLGSGSPFFDIVLPCGGGITLAIHVISQPDEIAELVLCIEQRKEMTLELRLATNDLVVSESKGMSGWNGEGFVVGYMPPPQILLHGQGIEPETFVELAKAAGVAVARSELPVHAYIDSYTAVVLLQHDLEKDMPLLQMALATDAFYIGCLGSRKTHQRRGQRLAEIGFLPSQIGRIQAPIGMWGPTRDARSLAISVLAEIVARYNKL
ncbi:XdhC family protein [Ochrobactrum vermis]|nr:XdhC family protein [Ochrobactrum vermis]PQZ26946.1 hypothetical protein CQZ93_24170 [Ochrobactrum vermis]